jgi:ubiquinone/menaquinone biosynthesis C-methylase UbiE
MSQKEIIEHYSLRFKEAGRLTEGANRLEKLRTLDLLKRFLPEPPVVILDVGGGSGVYAFPLSEQGYTVHLSDITPLHIEEAKKIDKKQSRHRLASIEVGDAREIKQPNNSADAVLFFGPLYHLTDRKDRIEALKEARRVLKENGRLFVAAIPKFASFLDGVKGDFIRDPDFVKIVEADIKTGQHRNPMHHPDYFTTAFFHHPNELRTELETANFRNVSLFSVEGPLWLTSNLGELLKDGKQEKILLRFLREIEEDQTIIGASEHIMAIGQK